MCPFCLSISAIKSLAASFHCRKYLLPVRVLTHVQLCSGSHSLVAVPGSVRRGKSNGGFGHPLLQKAALAHGSVCEGCKECLALCLELVLMRLWDVGRSSLLSAHCFRRPCERSSCDAALSLPAPSHPGAELGLQRESLC